MIKIHAIQTGLVRVKEAQRHRRRGGLLRTITDREWTEWLPILVWLIEHPEGLFLVDTGETARTSEPGYFPSWHPYYRWAVETRVAPEEEVGPQLREMGVEPDEVGTVILTHLHTDHAGGLHHFPKSRILASPQEVSNASGWMGRIRGYLPQHWPDWFDPGTPDTGRIRKIGPFEAAYPITEDGAVVVVPTRGHTPHHLSVVVTTGERRYFLAGDTSYTQQALLEQEADGISPDPEAARSTQSRILALASGRPLVYLPSHDPQAVQRLDNDEAIPGANAAGALMTYHSVRRGGWA